MSVAASPSLDHAVMELDAQADPGPPLPLFRRAEDAAPFPLETLPATLRDGVIGIVGAVQCPAVLAAQSVMAAAALVAQAQVDAPLFNGSRRPCSLFFVTIAESGERKSSADSLAGRPIREFEQRLADAYCSQVLAYKNRLEAWEEARKYAKKAHKGDVDAVKAALDALGSEPQPPLFPQLRCTEPTAEGLWLLLQNGHGTCGLLSAEGGQFLGGHAMSKDHRIKTAAFLSRLWDGESIDRVRKGDGLAVITGRRFAMHLMVQPDIGARLLGDRELTDQGFLSRMLICAPTSTQGTRLQRPPSDLERAALERYCAVLADRVALKAATSDGRNTLTPHVLRFSPDAEAMLNGFAAWCEAGLSPEGDLRPIAGFANKLPEHAARLATVFAFIENADAQIIDAVAMAAATALARWYAGERLRLAANASITETLLQAERLRAWLLSDWPHDHISPVEVYQRGPRFARTKAVASRLIATLEEHQWLRAVGEPVKIDGVRRREPYRIVREGTA